MPFTHTNTARFDQKFDDDGIVGAGDLVKLEAKPEVSKLTKIERRRKQKQREQELSQILEMQMQGTVDTEKVLKAVNEGGEI